MKCSSCGAEIPQGTIVCEFCGSAIDMPQHALAASAHAGIFAKVLGSREYQGRNSAERLAELPKLSAMETAIPVVFFGIFITASGFMTVMFAAMVPFAAIVPAGFVVIGVLLLIKTLGKVKQISAAGVLARAAIVATKRTAVSGGSGDSSAHTSYHVTFEFEDGRRGEYAVPGKLYAELAERDAGVLFSRADWVQAFDRVTSF